MKKIALFAAYAMLFCMPLSAQQSHRVDEYVNSINPKQRAYLSSTGIVITGKVPKARAFSRFNGTAEMARYSIDCSRYYRTTLPQQVNVYLQKEEVSLAIGKSGYNIQLASKLIGYQIDVYRITDSVTEEEDIRLDAYVKSGEIDEWIVDELNKIGCDYAKSVLALSEEELESRTDLEVETIRDVLAILKKDFEEESK